MIHRHATVLMPTVVLISLVIRPPLVAQDGAEVKRSFYQIQRDMEALNDEAERWKQTKQLLEQLQRRIDTVSSEFEKPKTAELTSQLTTARQQVESLLGDLYYRDLGPAGLRNVTPGLGGTEGEPLRGADEEADAEGGLDKREEIRKAINAVKAVETLEQRVEDGDVAVEILVVELETVQEEYDRVMAGDLSPLKRLRSEPLRAGWPNDGPVKPDLLRRCNRLESAIRTLKEDVTKVDGLKDNTLNMVIDGLRKADELTPTSEAQKVRAQLNQLDLEMQDALRAQSDQNVLDQRLVWAVYGMIAAIVVMYTSLGWFRRELAESIIERRVLIETLSMGFLLLTVIVLGTGRLLDADILGTLLGTIAGYIFGRKTAETESLSARRDGVHGATAESPEAGETQSTRARRKRNG